MSVTSAKTPSEILPFHDVPKNLLSAMIISMTANIQEEKENWMQGERQRKLQEMGRGSKRGK